LKDVARGRKMDLAKVRKLAEGKIYNGEQALKLGLVSQLGDFRQALYYAHQMAKLPGTVPNLIPLVDNPWDDFINQFPKIETHTLPNLISAMARIIISGDYNSAKPMTQSPERKFMDNRNQSDAIIQYRYLP
jgi:ClpP class serine protease